MPFDQIPVFETEDAASERAAEFFQRRRFWDWGEKDQAELDAWLAESLRHRAAYLRVEGIAARADRLAAQRPFRFARKPAETARARRFIYPLLAAAMVGLAFIFGPALVDDLLQPPDRIFSTYIGGRTLLSFADHTQIELNTDTVARFRMTNHERTVWLEKGEAWFHVAHNANNPFTVIIGTHRVNDLGTEFLVRRETQGLEVALLNGRATLSTDGAPTATLKPGDEAYAVRNVVSITRKSPQELADELSWRRGVLVFRDAKLADAVKEFNRYSTTKLVIADPSIADLKFSAEVRNDNFEGFLLVAQTMLKLRADREGNDVLLSREPEKTRKAVHAKHSL